MSYPEPDPAEQMIARLGLVPHPEGGYFRRIHESALLVHRQGRPRPASTAIAFLLQEGQCSQWHRVDADELWLWRDGGALQLQVFDPSTNRLQLVLLGDGLAHYPEAPEALLAFHAVQAGCWQRAVSLAPWSLVHCVVTPGFQWTGFTLIADAPDVQAHLRALDAL